MPQQKIDLSQQGQPLGDTDWNGYTVTNLREPVAPRDAATMSYVHKIWAIVRAAYTAAAAAAQAAAIAASQGLPLSLTGAVQPTRYVGGTSGGAPTTGTFAVRDYVVDDAGTIWICTVAGTPGTWKQVSGSGSGSGALVWPGGVFPVVKGFVSIQGNLDVVTRALPAKSGTYQVIDGFVTVPVSDPTSVTNIPSAMRIYLATHFN